MQSIFGKRQRLLCPPCKVCCNDHKEASQLICNLAPGTLCFGSALESINHPRHFDGLPVKNKSVISFSFVISRLWTETIISFSNPIPDFLQIITGFCNYTYMLRFSFSVTLGCLYHRQVLMGFSSESFIPNSCSCPGQKNKTSPIMGFVTSIENSSIMYLPTNNKIVQFLDKE